MAQALNKSAYSQEPSPTLRDLCDLPLHPEYSIDGDLKTSLEQLHQTCQRQKDEAAPRWISVYEEAIEIVKQLIGRREQKITGLQQKQHQTDQHKRVLDKARRALPEMLKNGLAEELARLERHQTDITSVLSTVNDQAVLPICHNIEGGRLQITVDLSQPKHLGRITDLVSEWNKKVVNDAQWFAKLTTDEAVKTLNAASPLILRTPLSLPKSVSDDAFAQFEVPPQTIPTPRKAKFSLRSIGHSSMIASLIIAVLSQLWPDNELKGEISAGSLALAVGISLVMYLRYKKRLGRFVEQKLADSQSQLSRAFAEAARKQILEPHRQQLQRWLNIVFGEWQSELEEWTSRNLEALVPSATASHRSLATQDPAVRRFNEMLFKLKKRHRDLTA